MVDKMKVYVKELTYKTSQLYEILDITSDVIKVVRESGINNGICVIHLPHATAALIINENERGLINDFIKLVKEIFPRNGKWEHNLIDDNAAAHLASGIIGATKVFPVVNGSLIRGTWQNILLLELDGPRYRRVIVEVLGE